MVKVRFTRLKNTARIPTRKTQKSVGYDIFACLEKDVVINPMEVKAIPTGISIELPEGVECQIRARSGLALKYGITIANCIGTIDPDYRGEVKVILVNLGKEPFTIKNGTRIAQMVFSKYLSVEFEEGELSETARGSGGFGSTGI